MNKEIYKNKYLHSLLCYIENNISSDLDTELLSSIGYVSRNKLYYDFYNLSGHSVKKYIRKRRLSNALALTKASDFSLTEIAFQCGYSSHQALCRAVKQTLDLTPSEYKSGDTYYFFPPFNGDPIQPIVVSNETIPPMLHLSFYHSRPTNIENKAIDTFLKINSNYVGRILGRNGKQKGNRFCYEIYLTDRNIDYDTLKLSGFETVREVSRVSSVFATSTVPNDEHKINAAWDYLYSEWLQNSMFEYTDEQYYEEYMLKNGKCCKVKLYLPIRERCEETKITLINNIELRFVAARAEGYNAEEIASKMVINYLTAYYPYIINTSKELYLQKKINAYICGVKVHSDFRFIENEDIMCITTNPCTYLVLESSVMGDYDRYTELLLSFSENNGMDADKSGIFAIYDGKESFNNLKIKMYCPIKIRTK